MVTTAGRRRVAPAVEVPPGKLIRNTGTTITSPKFALSGFPSGRRIRFLQDHVHCFTGPQRFGLARIGPDLDKVTQRLYAQHFGTLLGEW